MEADVISRRITQLQLFMDAVIEFEDLRACLAVICFLKCEEDDRWNKIREEIEKAPKRVSALWSGVNKKMFEGKAGLRVEEFEGLSTNIHVSLGPEYTEYAQQIDKLAGRTRSLYEKLEKETLQLMGDLNSACRTLVRIGDCCIEGEKIHVEFNGKVQKGKWEAMEGTYRALHEMATSWGR